MEQAVNVIYKLAEYPDIVCGDLIKKIAIKCCEETDGAKKDNDDDDRGDKPEQDDKIDEKEEDGEGKSETSEQMEKG